MPKLLIYDINHTFGSKSLLSNWSFLKNIYREVKLILHLEISVIIKQNVYIVMWINVGHSGLLREPRSNGDSSWTQKSKTVTVRNYFLWYERAVRKFIHLTNTGNKRENLPKQRVREKETKLSVSTLYSLPYIWICRRPTTSSTLLESRGRRSPGVKVNKKWSTKDESRWAPWCWWSDNTLVWQLQEVFHNITMKAWYGDQGRMGKLLDHAAGENDS